MRFLSLLVLVTGLAGCTDRLMGQAPERDLVFKAYSVPEGFQEQIRDIGNQAFSVMRSSDNVAAGRLETLPNGQLALVAPESIHKGFAEMIEQVRNSPKSAPINATFQCWMVVSQKNGGTGQDPALNEIREVAETLNKKGVENLQLLEKFHIASIMGRKSQIQGKYFQLYQIINRYGPQWSLDLQFEGRNGIRSELSTQLLMEKDQYVLLGVTKFSGEYHPDDTYMKNILEDASPYLYVVVKISATESMF